MHRILFLTLLLTLNSCGIRDSKLGMSERMYLMDRLPDDLKFKATFSSKLGNGYPLLVAASKAMPKNVGLKEFNALRSKPVSIHSINESDQFLAKFAEPLGLVSRASKSEYFRTTFQSEIGYKELSSTKLLLKLLLLRAELEVFRGNSKHALQDFSIASKICEGMLGAESSVIHYLVGVACYSIFGTAACQVAYMPQAQRSLVVSILDSLPKRPDGTQFAQQYLSELNTFQLPSIKQFESLIRSPGRAPDQTKEILTAAAAALKGHHDPYDSNQTANTLFRLARQIVSNCKGSWANRLDIEKEVSSLGSVWPESLYESEFTDYVLGSEPNMIPTAVINESRVRVSKVANPFGKLLVFSLLQSFVQLERADFLARVRNDAARISLASRLYSFDHSGRVALGLSDLELYTRIPLDPFSDKPYSYDAKRRVFWSASTNGLNDGGMGHVGKYSESQLDYIWPLDGRRVNVAAN